jgi:uncharacterized protein DUF3147
MEFAQSEATPRTGMIDILLRFIVGGSVVSAFALLGDILKPKSFAGLFGAAPSVAIATLVLTVSTQGKEYTSVEARSMLFGAVAFFLYALLVSRLLIRGRRPVLPVTALSIMLWFGCAFGCWYAVLR